MAIAPLPMPRTARPGGYPNPNTGGGPLGNLLGWNGNPFYDAFDSRRNMLMGLGADLLSGDWGRGGAMQGAQMDDAYATQQKAEAERQAQINQTTEWLRENYPQFADLPPDQGFQLAMKAMSEQQQGADAATFGLTPIYGVGPDGQPTIAQLSNQGGIQPVQMPEGFQVAKDPIRMDAGTHFVLLDPVTRQQIGMIPKNGDVPPGYRQTGVGEIAPMPGSEPDTERRGQQVKAATALTTLEEKNAIAVGAIDAAIQQASGWNTGNVMGNSGWVPGLGQGALDLGKTLDTIKANIGFEELQTMRDNSPTGGALGQVTERELAFLQSTIANIEQSQSEEQLKRNLKTLRDFIAASQERRRAAYEQQYGGGQSAPAGDDVESILGGYGIYGNP